MKSISLELQNTHFQNDIHKERNSLEQQLEEESALMATDSMGYYRNLKYWKMN